MNDIITTDSLTLVAFNNFLKPTSSFSMLSFLQEMSQFAKSQKDQSIPFPRNKKSGGNKLAQAKSMDNTLEPMKKTTGTIRARNFCSEEIVGIPEMIPFINEINGRKPKSFYFDDDDTKKALKAIRENQRFMSQPMLKLAEEGKELHKVIQKILANHKKNQKNRAAKRVKET